MEISKTLRAVTRSAHDFVARHAPVVFVVDLDFLNNLRVRWHRHTRLARCTHICCVGALQSEGSIREGREKRGDRGPPGLDECAVEQRGQHIGVLGGIGVDTKGVGRGARVRGLAEEFGMGGGCTEVVQR
jgi:hypothetical protein